MKKEPTLNEVIEKMKELNDEGYDCYFKGNGNGIVIPVAEIWEIKYDK